MDIHFHSTVVIKGNQYFAVFKVEGEGFGKEIDGKPAVPMSRDGLKCYTLIDRLQEHNTHTPPYDSEEACNEYIERIANAVAETIEAYNNDKYERVEPLDNRWLGAGFHITEGQDDGKNWGTTDGIPPVFLESTDTKDADDETSSEEEAGKN